MAVTFSEIMEATGWSHNTVSHKMKVLGITPSFRKGRVFYYSDDAVDRISSYRPMAFRPGTRFYRVCVRLSGRWLVRRAGLSRRQAEQEVRRFSDDGYVAKMIPC